MCRSRSPHSLLQFQTNMINRLRFLIPLCFSFAVATKRLPKLTVFEILRFPNDPCITSSTKNGTCYTSDECSQKGGVSGGSCAQGYGVCCIFTVGCGSTTSENSTYFEASGLGAGQCRAKVCPCSSNICQIRLDFNTFVITGPSTETTSRFKTLGGADVGAAGKDSTHATTCATDVFSITNAPNLPELCGVLTGDHVYFDASQACHDLGLALGQAGIDATIPANRMVNIKITQYSCDYTNLAPQGCDQWFFGTEGTGVVRTFNFNNGPHLANQKQNICIRREANKCKACFYAQAVIDVQLSGNAAAAVTKASICCGYGQGGVKTTGYDCLMIPGAMLNTANLMPKGATQCGSGAGIAGVAATASTVCTSSMPFRIDFYSDGFEFKNEAAKLQKGFKIAYFETNCVN